jgi:GTP pyrophosphokinase
MVPDHFQDYISTPKANGYQSIHTVVIGPEQRRIEIQIRTEEMNEVAELGVAAHWRYKQKHYAKDGKQYAWIRELIAILEQTSDPDEFLKHTKLAINYAQVFCFTPRGELIALPKGATCIDFAYSVHSDVGNHCTGSKINGKLCPLRTVLQNGDQVEIITAKNQHPSPSWEKFVITQKAKSEIKKFIKNQQRTEYVNLGRSILEKTFKLADIKDGFKVLQTRLNHFKKKTEEDLFCAIGEGAISREDVIKLFKDENKPIVSKFKNKLTIFKFRKKTDADAQSVAIKNMIPGMAIHYAGCCHPIPGDNIIGIIHTGKGVTVHTSDCHMIENFRSTPERFLNISWDSDSSNKPYVGRIIITLMNEIGSFASITTSIAQMSGNIINLRIINRTSDFFEVLVDIEVAGVTQLNQIMTKLNDLPQMHSVKRLKY